MRQCTHTYIHKYTHTQQIPATRVSEKTGEHFVHNYSGRVQKLASESAAFVASRFNWRLAQLCLTCAQRDSAALDHHGPCSAAGVYAAAFPAECLASFDCRVGSYSSLEEALALVLWRAQDCAANGVSDMVHHLKGDTISLPTEELAGERAAVSGQSTAAKLQWLHRAGLLPLPDHQAYGSFFCAVRRVRESVNRKSGAVERRLRRCVETVDGNVLLNWLQGSLLLQDDALEQELQDDALQLPMTTVNEEFKKEM